ncbi:uncharacterized protein AFUA_1G01170 [Aspergillus fumigatus Af293]
MFSKPINNLSGAGAGARIIHTLDEYWRSFVPGHMWSALLTGEHISTDIAVDAGRAVWFAHTKGVAGPDKTWEYWEVNTPVEPSLEKYITDLVEPHLAGYTGMMNVETIGGKIIEVHLRFSPQWPNMYGSWFIASLVDLYCGKGWTGPSASKIASPVGYSVPLNMLRPVRLSRKTLCGGWKACSMSKASSKAPLCSMVRRSHWKVPQGRLVALGLLGSTAMTLRGASWPGVRCRHTSISWMIQTRDTRYFDFHLSSHHCEYKSIPLSSDSSSPTRTASAQVWSTCIDCCIHGILL